MDPPDGVEAMDVLEVVFTTWVGWPIFAAAATLLGYWAWENIDS